MPSLPKASLPPIGIRASFQTLLAYFSTFGKIPAGPPVANQARAIPILELYEHVGQDRTAAEKFIRQRSGENFGSCVGIFMPRLFSLRNQDGDICGAFGLRSANRKLFVEQYLDSPIDKIIATRAGRLIERRHIVEVGHFSGTFPGAVRAMIELLTERLYSEGVEWVVFARTTPLRNAFFDLGLSPMDVQAATVEHWPEDERVAREDDNDHARRVLVGNVREGYLAMHPRLAGRRQS